MNWKLTSRRAVVTLTTTALVLIAILGSSLGTMATETGSRKKTPHARSSVVALVLGQPLIITIEHPYYEVGSLVTYAQVNDASDKPVGYLLPVGINPSVPGKTAQIVKANRLTVAFDTTQWYKSPPDSGSPYPGTYTGVPMTGSGSIIIITGNVPTDTPPEVAIEIEAAQLVL